MSQCWEQCFRTLSSEDNLGILEEVFKSGSDIRRMKNVNSANGITFLLDSALGTNCDSVSSSEDLTGRFQGQLYGENATALFQMQLQLMAIFSAMAGNIRIYTIQFNENMAWGCTQYYCLDCCAPFYFANFNNYLTPIQVNQTACNDGLLEPACRLGYEAMLGNTCTSGGNYRNNMTVAILNSNGHSHVHKHGYYADYSPCSTFYQHRYAVGIHEAKEDDLRRFASRDDAFNYISDVLKYRNVVRSLFNCMNTRCCSSGSSLSVATSCQGAYGHNGEIIRTLSNVSPNFV